MSDRNRLPIAIDLWIRSSWGIYSDSDYLGFMNIIGTDNCRAWPVFSKCQLLAVSSEHDLGCEAQATSKLPHRHWCGATTRSASRTPAFFQSIKDPRWLESTKSLAHQHNTHISLESCSIRTQIWRATPPDNCRTFDAVYRPLFDANKPLSAA